MKKINQKFFEVIFLFILSLTPLLWLSRNQLILGHDSGFRLNPLNHLQNLFFSWSNISNFGVDWSFFKGFLITQFPEAFFTLITHSLWAGQILTFIFWFFLMGIAMYIALASLFPDKKLWFFRIFSSMLYMYNFFILQGWFIAERGKFSAYAALPLGFAIIINTIKKKYSLIKGTVLFSFLFFFLNAGGNPSLYGGLLLTFIVVFSFFLLQSVISRKKQLFVSILLTIASFITGTVMINAYWILPQAYLAFHSYANRLSGGGGVEGILLWEGVISKNASILNLFRLQGIPDWYDNPLHPYANYFLTNPILTLISCLFFAILLYGLVLFKKNKRESGEKQTISLLLFIFLIGIIFTGGTHAPFGGLYGFLIIHVPGFAIFRSSYYKFSPTLFFSSSVLIGFFLQQILMSYLKSSRAFFIACVFAIGILCIYNFPFFVSNFFMFNPPFTTKVTLPPYATNAFSYIGAHVDPQVKILLLPDLDPSTSADSYTWGYWSLDLLPRIALKNPIIASDSDTDIVKALYSAIKTNNQPLFMRLAQMSGIRKVLWRGDVLYNDHTTTSNDLLDEKNNLSAFTGVHLEKDFGKWKLYSLQLPQEKIFQPVTTISNFSTQNSLQDILGGENFIENQQNMQNSSVSLLTSKIVISPSCDSCNIGGIDSLKNSLSLPTIRFLPWSKFYIFVAYLENRESKKVASNPQARLDFDISTASKRLVEIWDMGFKDFTSNSGAYAGSNAKKYELLMNDAIAQINTIPPMQKNDYLQRLIAYMEFQQQYIRVFTFSDSLRKSANELLTYTDRNLAQLSTLVWTSMSNEDRKSFIQVQEAGMYALTIQQDFPSQFSAFVDGTKIDDTEQVYLTKGSHKIEITYPVSPNRAVMDSNFLNNPLLLTTQQKYVATVSNFSSLQNYFITFTYTIPSDQKASFSIQQENGKNDLPGSLLTPFSSGLIADGQPHIFSYYYQPYVGANTARFLFSSQKKATISLSNFVVEQDINPRIYFTKTTKVPDQTPPKIFYMELDPTNYTVSVRNAKQPFILLFNQSFAAGWQASIPNASHIEMNGYANGWYIVQKGDYTIHISYEPQKYFYIGLGITILVFFIFCILLKGIKK